MKDSELLKELKKSDEKAFEELFRRYFTVLHNYAGFYTGRTQIAEDIVHDIFYKIWDTRSTLVIHTSLKPYLYRAVHNNCIQHLRHLKVVKEHSRKNEARLEEALLMNKLYLETGLSKLYENEIRELVVAVIDKLPDKTRNIYELSRNQHKKNFEIAKILKVTEKTIEYHISRVLVLLREELKDYLPGIIIILICGSL